MDNRIWKMVKGETVEIEEETGSEKTIVLSIDQQGLIEQTNLDKYKKALKEKKVEHILKERSKKCHIAAEHLARLYSVFYKADIDNDIDLLDVNVIDGRGYRKRFIISIFITAKEEYLGRDAYQDDFEYYVMTIEKALEKITRMEWVGKGISRKYGGIHGNRMTFLVPLQLTVSEIRELLHYVLKHELQRGKCRTFDKILHEEISISHNLLRLIKKHSYSDLFIAGIISQKHSKQYNGLGSFNSKSVEIRIKRDTLQEKRLAYY